jgi:CheY-like chemotaxis protein
MAAAVKPAAPATVAPAMAKEPLPPPRGRILVVDDEPAVVDFQVDYLSSLGLDVQAACDGSAAIAVLEAGEVDLIISDIRMPGPVDGRALYRWVLASRPHLVERFLFTSGDPTALGRDAGTTLPAACLAKPFTLQELATRVRELLAKRMVRR